MPVYKIRFTLNGRKARWVTPTVGSMTNATEWFNSMLSENYGLSPCQVESIIKSSTMTDVTSACTNKPKVLYMPESKMFKF